MIRTTRSSTGAAAVALFAGLIALSGCGGQPSSAETSGGASASAKASGDASAAGSEFLPAAEGQTTYPLTLESPWGSTELAARPARIAAVTPSQDDAEILAALGVTPYLASDETTDAWVENALSTPIPERFTRGDDPIPIEQVAAAKPDLIIVLGTDLSDSYEKLSAIAPVLSTAKEGASEGKNVNDWDANILRVGEVLDLKDAAQKALDKENEFFETFRTEHPEFAGKSVSYVVYYGDTGGLQFHSSVGSPAGGVLEQMGFEPAPKASELKYREEISAENLAVIDADVIVFSDNSGGKYATITDLPLFKNLAGVKADHLVLIDNRDGTFAIDGTEHQGNLPWALARSGPLSGTWAAEQIAPAIAKVLGN